MPRATSIPSTEARDAERVLVNHVREQNDDLRSCCVHLLQDLLHRLDLIHDRTPSSSGGGGWPGTECHSTETRDPHAHAGELR